MHLLFMNAQPKLYVDYVIVFLVAVFLIFIIMFISNIPLGFSEDYCKSLLAKKHPIVNNINLEESKFDDIVIKSGSLQDVELTIVKNQSVESCELVYLSNSLTLSERYSCDNARGFATENIDSFAIEKTKAFGYLNINLQLQSQGKVKNIIIYINPSRQDIYNNTLTKIDDMIYSGDCLLK